MNAKYNDYLFNSFHASAHDILQCVFYMWLVCRLFNVVYEFGMRLL